MIIDTIKNMDTIPHEELSQHDKEVSDAVDIAAQKLSDTIDDELINSIINERAADLAKAFNEEIRTNGL